MPNPWLILGFVLALAGAYVAGDYRGAHNKEVEWTAKVEKERADASEAARKQEQMWQGVVNGTVANQQKEIGRVRGLLTVALDGLRARPERPTGVSIAPRPGCAGGNGAELSRTDAEFLSREAARADEIRAGLDACYRVIDALHKGRG